MMLFCVEIILVGVLITILLMLMIDERKNRAVYMREAHIKGIWNGSERRKATRIKIGLNIKCISCDKLKDVQSIDISTSGIGLLLAEKFEKGTPISLEIKLPEEKELIKTQGEVIWTKEALDEKNDLGIRLFNTGIKFYRFHHTDEKKLFDFISRQS